MGGVPALEGFLRGARFDLLVALVAVRNAAGRSDIAVPLLARVHAPVIILFSLRAGRKLGVDISHKVGRKIEIRFVLITMLLTDGHQAASQQPGQLINPLIRCVYPDASGKNRKSVNGSESDHALLRQAGFNVQVNPSNPFVRDRVLAVNAQFLNGEGERRLLINTDKCPHTTQVLEQQAYNDQGDPAKDGTEDPADAFGYFVVQRFPIIHNVATVQPLRI